MLNVWRTMWACTGDQSIRKFRRTPFAKAEAALDRILLVSLTRNSHTHTRTYGRIMREQPPHNHCNAHMPIIYIWHSRISHYWCVRAWLNIFVSDMESSHVSLSAAHVFARGHGCAHVYWMFLEMCCCRRCRPKPWLCDAFFICNFLTFAFYWVWYGVRILISHMFYI